MRRTRFLLALPVILFSACNQQLIDTTAHPQGEVVISLEADERTETVSVKSGTETAVPDKGDFWVEIINSENVTFKREKFSDIEGKAISLNADDFTMVARHGDPLGVGFDKPFYKAEESFTVKPHDRVSVNAVAKLANVKVAVNYGDNIKTDYSDFYTVIKHAGHKNTALTFERNETRAGYIPAGDLMVIVYATINGELKCFTLRDSNGDPKLINCSPNDFITFNINTAVNYGDLIFNIKIDNGTEVVEKNFDVPADAAGSDLKPSILLTSFDSRGEYHVTEGTETSVEDMGFTYKTYSGLEECVLYIDSKYMREAGVPSEIDFISLDDAQVKELEDMGFFIAEHAGIGVIDFAAFLPRISKSSVYEGENTVAATFTLKVKDANGDIATKTARIVLTDVTASVQVYDYNVWAKKIVDPVVTLYNAKDPTLAKVQVSMNASEWYDLKSVTSNPFNIGTQADLTPGTTYYYRVLYRDKYVVSSNVGVTTESALQVDNNGFEEWNTKYWDFNHNGSANSQSSPMNYYKPWTSGETDIWWDSNTTTSLRPSLTVGYTFFKTYPLVHYSTDAHTGNRSAQLTVANVGNGNSVLATTGTWYVGELFIGKGNDGSDGGWSRTAEGHSFSSRPQSMTFWYEYEPNTSSHTFSVEIELLSSDGTVLAKASATPSSQSSWKSLTLPLDYTITNKKAHSIRISFKASTASSFSCSAGGSYLEIAGAKNEGDRYRIKLNAALRIDDITLNY